MSSPWGNSIRNNQYPEEVDVLLSKVENYASGFKEPAKVHEYVEALGWKMRMDGRHLPNGDNRVSEVIKDNSITWTIAHATNNWFEVAKVMGPVIEAEDIYFDRFGMRLSKNTGFTCHKGNRCSARICRRHHSR